MLFDMSGILFVVATPIGNLEDITLRAKQTLESCDIVVCEDTRVSGKLLKAYGLSKPFISLHEHTSDQQLLRVVGEIAAGKRVVYISDAGTPGVNDPGGKLVQAALQRGLTVSPIPGCSALTAAISVCGFPMERFTYLGFVPHKKGRETFFREIGERADASVFFESTHRIEKTVVSLQQILEPARLVFIGRELTKIHETLYRGSIDEISEKLHATSLKGEFVIIVCPKHFT